MNELTPIPPSDSGFQLMEPMANSPAPAATKFRLHKFWLFLRKFWWIPLITLTLSVGTSVALFLDAPPIFVATGSLWETAKIRLQGEADFDEDRNNFLGTQAQLLRSDTLREMTTNRVAAVNTDQDILKHLLIPVEIQVFASPGSSIYTIQARSGNPAFTPVYLNALMEQYLEFRRNVKKEVSTSTLASISEQVQRLERDMKTAQAALTEYEKTNNFATLQEEASIEATHLVQLKTQLSDYELDYQLLQAKELEADASIADTKVVMLQTHNPLVSGPSPRLDAQKQIEVLKTERERLAQYLLPKHPKMIKLGLDITNAQELVEVYHNQNHEQIVVAKQALEIRMENTKRFISQWETNVAADNNLLASADGLKQEVARNQGMYERLSDLLQNLKVSRDIDTENLAILERAKKSSRSYADLKSKLSQSGFLGLGLGLGIIFLLMWRDDRFSSLVEVTEKFGDNVVGQVPELPVMRGAEPLALLADNDDRHAYAESYRNLRSALLYLSVEGRRPRMVIITSAVPNEGKSTVATNLARTLALGGARVLLVDCDLRKGAIHDVLKLSSKPGLSDLLREPGDPGQFIQATDLPNFSFLARGGITRNPGDLLLSPAIDQLLAQFRERYDYVVIDSSPVFAADDTSTIAAKADGVFFVVRSRFSHARMVRDALELLFQRQAKVLGLILNRSDSSRHSYYHYKYAEYYAKASEDAAAKDS